jgi:hypothetical protein
VVQCQKAGCHCVGLWPRLAPAATASALHHMLRSCRAPLAHTRQLPSRSRCCTPLAPNNSVPSRTLSYYWGPVDGKGPLPPWTSRCGAAVMLPVPGYNVKNFVLRTSQRAGDRTLAQALRPVCLEIPYSIAPGHAAVVRRPLTCVYGQRTCQACSVASHQAAPDNVHLHCAPCPRC